MSFEEPPEPDDLFAYWEQSLENTPDSPGDDYGELIDEPGITAPSNPESARSEDSQDSEFGTSDGLQELEQVFADESERAAMAYELFEQNAVHTPPALEEIQDIINDASTMEWIDNVAFNGLRTRDTFGQVWSENPNNFDPYDVGKVVERQFGRFTDTLSELTDDMEAAAKIAQWAEAHVGKSLVTQVPWWTTDENRTTYGIGQFSIYKDADGRPAVHDAGHYFNEGQLPLLRYDAPGEIHLLSQHDNSRYIVRGEDGEVKVYMQSIDTLVTDDPAYYGELSQLLGIHRNLLLEAAEGAGFNRAAIINPETGVLNIAHLIEEVSPKMESTDLPTVLSGELMGKIVHNAAAIVNLILGTNHEEEGTQLAKRAARTRRFFSTMKNLAEEQ